MIRCSRLCRKSLICRCWRSQPACRQPQGLPQSMAPTFKPDGMPSMRQDVLAQRPTEVEEFAGVVRRLAQKHGMPTPANDFFYEKIREIEANYNK
ncbi:MAG: ketopantoate reductase family protein [Faecalibacterium prausnitzii]